MDAVCWRQQLCAGLLVDAVQPDVTYQQILALRFRWLQHLATSTVAAAVSRSDSRCGFQCEHEGWLSASHACCPDPFSTVLWCHRSVVVVVVGGVRVIATRQWPAIANCSSCSSLLVPIMAWCPACPSVASRTFTLHGTKMCCNSCGLISCGLKPDGP
jgi:hypothetical protein